MLNKTGALSLIALIGLAACTAGPPAEVAAPAMPEPMVEPVEPPVVGTICDPVTGVCSAA